MCLNKCSARLAGHTRFEKFMSMANPTIKNPVFNKFFQFFIRFLPCYVENQGGGDITIANNNHVSISCCVREERSGYTTPPLQQSMEVVPNVDQGLLPGSPHSPREQFNIQTSLLVIMLILSLVLLLVNFVTKTKFLLSFGTKFRSDQKGKSELDALGWASTSLQEGPSEDGPNKRHLLGLLRRTNWNEFAPGRFHNLKREKDFHLPVPARKACFGHPSKPGTLLCYRSIDREIATEEAYSL